MQIACKFCHISKSHIVPKTSYNAFIVLDTRRAKANNTYPLKLRIIVGRKSFHLPLKYSIEEKHWKTDKEQISSACKTIPNTARANIAIQKEKTKVLELLSVLDERGDLPVMSTKEIKVFILGGDTKTMLLAFGAEIIAELKAADKVGNARVYQTMLNSIGMFLKNTDIPMQKLSYKWLKQYEAWYLSRKNSKGKPNSLNGLSFHVRTLKALYNRAIKRELVPRDSYPFASYTIKHEKTRKRAISEADVLKLRDAVPQTARQQRAQDYFMMSFYLMGASFIDLAFLTTANIKNGRIEYRRRKTGQLHSIKITPQLQTLIDTYLAGKDGEDTPYILNVIKGDTEEQKYTAARDEMRRYNKALKQLAAVAGVESEVTSYTARHSFATIAKYKGVPTAVISEALGHQSEEITQVYLDSFDTAVLDKYNELILGK